MLRTLLLTVVLSLLVAGGAQAAPLSLVSVGSFSEPTYVTAAPGDRERLYVVERSGKVKVLRDGQTQTFADLSGVLSGLDPERGLFSIAFAPDFAQSRRFYAYFTGKAPFVPTTGDIAIVRMVAASPDSAPGAPELLLSIPHGAQGNHNGGQLQFGPDGFLYAGTGDGGSGDDAGGNGQNLDSRTPAIVDRTNHDPLLGKLLRLDVSGAGGYTSPPGNAFGPATKAPEIFAYGLRNPYRFSFDRLTGDLLIGDVGQNEREEVDFLPAGSPAGTNFGWHTWEGTRPTGGASDRTGFTFPALEYGHSAGAFGSLAGCSITGGYVSRDPQVPELAGRYVYGDYCASRLRSARLNAGGNSEDGDLAVPAFNDNSLISFGEDACGRLHVTTRDGTVQRLISGGGTCANGPVTGAPAAPGLPSGSPGSAPSTSKASRSAPRISIRRGSRRGQRAIRTGRVQLTVTCSRLCDLRAGGRFLIGRQKLGAKPGLAIHQRRDRLDGGARVRINLRSSSRTRRIAARALRRGKTVKARVVLRARTPGGSSRTRILRVRIRR